MKKPEQIVGNLAFHQVLDTVEDIAKLLDLKKEDNEYLDRINLHLTPPIYFNMSELEGLLLN